MVSGGGQVLHEQGLNVKVAEEIEPKKILQDKKN